MTNDPNSTHSGDAGARGEMPSGEAVEDSAREGTAVEFGLVIRSSDDIARQARDIEALGYDYATTGEHVFFHVPTSNAFVSLAVAAGATTTLRLMSSITLVPLYPAVLCAKLAASLAVASGGRFHLGVGVGGEMTSEFEACGVPVRERGARTNEALDIMQRLWTQDEVSFEGRFNTLSGVTLAPKPSPPPPVWVSGRQDAAWRRAALFGSGWLPYMYTPERLAESIEAIGRYRDEAGNATPVRPGLFAFFCCHPDNDTAVSYAAQRLSKQYAQDFSQLVHKYAIAGDPDRCTERLNEYIDAGARTIVLSAVAPASYIEQCERLMADEVLPRIRIARAEAVSVTVADA
ncbi:LLM class flavin-dependent oxidoreductase [Candidatus Poriferisodalis sp.]|uniref:LLM class flavin-dependent oxidoreductase n=1 Tax=Candidatus Poriferisodalis sp. TaxID=3101277 RepID=UPI003B015ADA